jgi:hypothetical protein
LHQSTLLPVTNPPPAPRETVFSYLSRLAATWRTDTATLARHMGAQFRRFLELDPAAMDALADWAELDPVQVQELLAWTGVPAGNVRMAFRGEIIVSRALRNPVVRGCPVCLREDAARHEGPPTAAMAMRGDWQMREAFVCVRHRHPLVELWRADRLADRHDMAARLREIEKDILSGALDRPAVLPSAYDLWLDGRLEDGTDDTWLKDQPLFAATTFCRLLGRALRPAELRDVDGADGADHAAGFDVARHGETAIRAALDRIAASATGPLDAPRKVFGPMYAALNRDYLREPGFALFGHILRDCILDHWPIAAGETLIGEVVAERRLHSLATAAEAAGVGVEVIEKLLIEAGAIPEGDDRPPSRRVFAARPCAELLAEIPTLADRTAMREAMGATKTELAALEEEGLLIPRTRVAGVKNPWRTPDGLAFVADLSVGATPVAADDRAWETLLLARKRTQVRLADLVAAIRDGRLTVGRRAGIAGFHGLVVRIAEVDALPSSRRRARSPLDVDPTGMTSSAMFGRSVSLRDGGTFIALIEAGHVPAVQVVNPATGRLQHYLRREEITAFHRRFATLTTLSAETGRHRNALRGQLAAAGVARFTPEGRDFGAVYRREEVVPALTHTRIASARTNRQNMVLDDAA